MPASAALRAGVRVRCRAHAWQASRRCTGGVVTPRHARLAAAAAQVDAALDAVEDGNENALKVGCMWSGGGEGNAGGRARARGERALRVAAPALCTQDLLALLQGQLAELISKLNGQLAPEDRKKLITLCTVDVHARDVVQRLVDAGVESQAAFEWQSQLRYYQSPQTKDCTVGVGVGEGEEGAPVPVAGYQSAWSLAWKPSFVLGVGEECSAKQTLLCSRYHPQGSDGI